MVCDHHGLTGDSILCLCRSPCELSCSVVSDSLRPCGLCLPGSSVYGISQAGILQWVAISSFRGSSWPRDWTHISCVSCIAGRFFTTEWPNNSNHKPTPVLGEEATLLQGLSLHAPHPLLFSEKLRKRFPGHPPSPKMHPHPCRVSCSQPPAPATPSGFRSHRAGRLLPNGSLRSCSSLVTLLSILGPQGQGGGSGSSQESSRETDPNWGEEGKWKFVKKRRAVAVAVILEV